MAKFGMKILLKKLPNFGTVKFGNIRQISHHLALAYVENFHGLREGSFSCVWSQWCHLYLVCVICNVIICRHIHVFQTNVLAKFALISHNRQNKDNYFG